MNGTFVFCVDVELAWGFLESKRIKPWHFAAVRNERSVLPPLLKTLDDYRIPATWGILGHVFLDRCERNGIPHPDMPRPNYKWFEGDWYKHDPCSDITRNPLWYGKDMAEEIIDFSRSARIEQDIGCHSFSHQAFSDPGCTVEVAEAEINKCLEIMKGYGIRPKTFVFPLGQVGHLKLLKEKGFNAFFSEIPQRIKGASLGRIAPSAFRRYVSSGIELLSNNSLRTPPIAVPKEVLSGLWEVQGSLCYNEKKGVPLDFVILRAKRAILHAMKEKKCFYMYTHLSNFGIDPPRLLRGFQSILRFVDKERCKGRLEVCSVQQLVNAVGN